MKTYIFGAGASMHAGYPLASDLWRAIQRWTIETFPDGHRLRGTIDTMNSEFDASKPFELVLTDLQRRIDAILKTPPTTGEGIEEKVRLVHTRSEIAELIPRYFQSVREQSAELYRLFATTFLSKGDAVVTFNYDMAIDRELQRSGKWSIGNGYGFDVDLKRFGDSPCKLFKLHGSTNWRGEPFQGMEGFGQTNLPPLGERPVIDRSEFEYLGYSGASDPQCHDGRVRIESLIMPTAEKRFYSQTSSGREWEGFWNSLWHQAGESLHASEEVYLIGYSVPEYDKRARELLKATIREFVPVKVCCHSGTDEVVQSLRHLGISNSQPAIESTFEQLMSR